VVARAAGTLEVETGGSASSAAKGAEPPAVLLAVVALAVVAALAGLVIWLRKRGRQGLEEKTRPKDASQEVEE
jgi:hypothetical protein